MSRKMKSKKNNIIFGFIVEGQSDANFLKHLVKDYFQNRFIAQIITMSGKASLVSASKIVISSFMQIGVDHVFILFDTDYQNFENQKSYLLTTIENSGFIEKVTIIPVDPILETWILSSSIKELESIKNMDYKTQMIKLHELGFKRKPLDFSNIKMDFNSMIENNTDFKEFINEMENKIASCQSNRLPRQ
jgi:hypothetical protein